MFYFFGSFKQNPFNNLKGNVLHIDPGCVLIGPSSCCFVVCTESFGFNTELLGLCVCSCIFICFDFFLCSDSLD